MRQRNISADAARMAASAARDFTNLRRAMDAAKDTIDGLDRAIKDPKIRTVRHTIKKSTSGPSSFISFLGVGLGAFGGSPGSFYRSASQNSADLADLLSQAQRIL